MPFTEYLPSMELTSAAIDTDARGAETGAETGMLKERLAVWRDSMTPESRPMSA